MAFEADIVNAIRQLMPADAEIRVANTITGLSVGVSWKLHDDPERPNKTSKTICIVVSHEAVQLMEERRRKHFDVSMNIYLGNSQPSIRATTRPSTSHHRWNSGQLVQVYYLGNSVSGGSYV